MEYIKFCAFILLSFFIIQCKEDEPAPKNNTSIKEENKQGNTSFHVISSNNSNLIVDSAYYYPIKNLKNGYTFSLEHKVSNGDIIKRLQINFVWQDSGKYHVSENFPQTKKCNALYIEGNMPDQTEYHAQSGFLRIDSFKTAQQKIWGHFNFSMTNNQQNQAIEIRNGKFDSVSTDI